MTTMQTQTYQSSATVQRNKVLRNTYSLLAMTLVFSAVTAGISAALQLPHPGILITLVGYFGLLFMVTRLQNSSAGIAAVFGLTGFMGYTLGPIINHYLALNNGQDIVMMSMAGTGLVFFAMSAIALNSKRDFSKMASFLTIGVLVAFIAGLAAVFLAIPALSLAVSAMFVLLMSGMILWQTSEIVRGGETNYIMATVSLYVSIFNLFTSLLQLLGFLNSDE